jgi:hypothetical protein
LLPILSSLGLSETAAVTLGGAVAASAALLRALRASHNLHYVKYDNEERQPNSCDKPFDNRDAS